MSKYLHIDFETRSRVDLNKYGADLYAQDPSTKVHCMMYAFDAEPIGEWKDGEALPQRISDHISNGGKVIGHNIGGFEVLIINHIMAPRYGWPKIKIAQCEDTMAMAYAMSLPGALDKVSAALGLDERKDAKGKRVMMQLAQPKEIKDDGTVIWYTRDGHPEKFEALYAYCRQDVVVEREIHDRLLLLTPKEHETWLLDWEINRRGVGVDTKSLNVCLQIIEKEKERLNAAMVVVTKGDVFACTNTAQLTKWLRIRSSVLVPGVAKDNVIELLSGELPDDCRKALLLRQEAAKTSTAKINVMLKSQNTDGRVRGLFQYHGASTGRWAGRRVQLHNLPRPKLKQNQIEQAFEIINSDTRIDHKLEDLHMFFNSPMSVVSDLIRGFLKARDGYDFISCDFTAIEARVLAWLAGQEDVLEVFRGHGKIYEHQASLIYDVPMSEITKEDPRRQIGKVAILALGFQGGAVAFQTMGKNYGVNISKDKAEGIKNSWRQSNQHIVNYWYKLERAAIAAVLNPGNAYPVGPKGRQVVYKKSGSFLWCKLPSGRVLCYPYARIKTFDTPWGEPKEGLTYKSVVLGKWCETKTYGGKLCENVTQAVARCLLSEAMPRLERHLYHTVLHIHDECVVEIPKDYGSIKEVVAIMSDVPMWAKDLPISASGWRGERFRK